MQVATAGYERETIEEFIHKLLSAEIDLLVDVRAVAHSRKRGFSKTSLTHHLQAAGIDYVHFPELGMPRHLRQQRDSVNGNKPILDAYDHLLPDREGAISQLMSTIQDRQAQACLMCFERDPEQCHRTRLASYLAQQFAEVSIQPLQAMDLGH